jgi:hypothetical protein
MSRFAPCLIAGLLVGPPGVHAMTLSEWEQHNDLFRAGFVWGVAESLVTFVDRPADQARADAYFKCFSENEINSGTALNMVKDHIRRTPDAATTQMAGTVLLTFVAACKRYLQATQK